MNEATRKAHETLARVEKTLEECRNRPRYEQEWRSPRTVTTPVVRKTNEEARVSRNMSPETQKAWDAWARSIARKEVNAATKIIFDVTKEGLFLACDKLNARLVELEREVKALKERQPAPSEEWPLRAIEGGRR